MQWYRQNKERAKLRGKQYRERNAEKIRETKRIYEQLHSDEIKLKKQAAHKANPEPGRVRTKAWRLEHPEQSKEAINAWRKANPEKVLAYHRKDQAKSKASRREYNKKWRENNLDKLRGYTHNYSAKKLSLPATLTEDQWSWLLEQSGYRCVYCTRHQDECGKLAQEHVIPVAQKGAYTITNIVPACKSCNSRKSGKTPEQAGMEMVIKIDVYKHMKQKGLFDE